MVWLLVSSKNGWTVPSDHRIVFLLEMPIFAIPPANKQYTDPFIYVQQSQFACVCWCDALIKLLTKLNMNCFTVPVLFRVPVSSDHSNIPFNLANPKESIFRFSVWTKYENWRLFPCFQFDMGNQNEIIGRLYVFFIFLWFPTDGRQTKDPFWDHYYIVLTVAPNVSQYFPY